MSVAKARAQRIRLASWGFLIMLPLIRVAMSLADLSVRDEVLWSDVLVYLVPTLLAVIGASFATAHTLGTLEHWLWGAVAVAVASVLVVESHWEWYVATVDFHGPSMHSPIRLALVVAVSMYFALFARMIGFGRQPLVARLRGLSDAFGTMVYLYAVTYVFWAVPAFAGFPDQIRNAIQTSFYPVVGIALLVFIVWLVIGWESRRWEVWQTLLAAAHVVYALGLVSFMVFYPATQTAAEQTVDYTSLVLGGGMYLMFIASVYRMTGGEESAIVHPLNLHRRGAFWHFYPAILATGLPLLAWKSQQLEADAAMPVLVSALLLALLLAVRSWASALEFAQHRIRAITDTLTGAHNVRYLRKRIRELTESAMYSGVPVTLVFADIDGFRCLNNSYGHHAGDRVLCALADVISAHLPIGCELFRAGSDEFVVVMPQYTVDEAVAFTSRVRSAALRSVSPNGVTRVGISFGIATSPQDEIDPKTLVACARAAERSVHHADSTGIRVFDPATMIARAPRGSHEDVRARSLRDTVRALAAAVDARDPATRNHSSNVAELATALGIAIGLPVERVDIIALAAQMHDLGKIGIPDSILLKLEPLSENERRAVEDHPYLGARILASASMNDLMPIVRSHHERWDGRGYPEALAGHDIPLEARILAVCDTYETLVAGRPYRRACEPSVAEAEIESASGTQFDPIVVESFLAMLRHGGRSDWAPYASIGDVQSAAAS